MKSSNTIALTHPQMTQITQIKLVGQGLKLTVVGLAMGFTAALWLTDLMSHFLFGVSARDPWTFATVALLLTSVSLLACYIPARRASKVDPMIALKHE